jgi:hypothetical protein
MVGGSGRRGCVASPTSHSTAHGPGRQPTTALWLIDSIDLRIFRVFGFGFVAIPSMMRVIIIVIEVVVHLHGTISGTTCSCRMSSNSRVSSQIQRQSSQIAIQHSAQDTHAGVVVKRNFRIRWENKNAHAILPRNFRNVHVADAFHRCGGRNFLVNRSDVNAVVYSVVDQQESKRCKDAENWMRSASSERNKQHRLELSSRMNSSPPLISSTVLTRCVNVLHRQFLQARVLSLAVPRHQYSLDLPGLVAYTDPASLVIHSPVPGPRTLVQ